MRVSRIEGSVAAATVDPSRTQASNAHAALSGGNRRLPGVKLAWLTSCCEFSSHGGKIMPS